MGKKLQNELWARPVPSKLSERRPLTFFNRRENGLFFPSHFSQLLQYKNFQEVSRDVIWKLTSGRFWKCGGFCCYNLLNQSCGCSKSTESGILSLSSKLCNFPFQVLPLNQPQNIPIKNHHIFGNGRTSASYGIPWIPQKCFCNREKSVCVCIVLVHYGPFPQEVKEKSVKLAVWAVSLNFLHDFTLFVVDIHQIRLISLFRHFPDHFHFHGSAGLIPKVNLSLRHTDII